MLVIFAAGARLLIKMCAGRYLAVCSRNQGFLFRSNKVYYLCEEDFRPHKWTVRDYDSCAELAVEDPDAETFGIKGHCIFNQLESFHCIQQLPPFFLK